MTDKQLERFLSSFADWSLFVRQESGNDDASVHPAPYLVHLRRPVVAGAATGLVVCPILVNAADILAAATEHDLVPQADNNRDFLPPVMSYEEEDRVVDKKLVDIVAEADLTPNGKKRLTQILLKHRAAFGMQLRKVNMKQDTVHTHTTGELPEHQPRRLIRNPQVRAAQIQWEQAMMERGVIGELSSTLPETVRPINLNHVIRDKKIRFTADTRTHNVVVI